MKPSTLVHKKLSHSETIGLRMHWNFTVSYLFTLVRFFMRVSIIDELGKSNRNQAQSGRYTELQDALNKRREVGTLEISYSKM